MHNVPHDCKLDHGDVRSQHHGIRAHQRARQCGLRFLPYQQQLYVDDRADRLRELTVPFDDVATNEQPGAFHIWGSFCGGELFHVSYDGELEHSGLRP